jgi:glycosyltransferase involved in cell wall biosynthesis
MHVGLNLIFLVPGETGGMEIVARELIPELVAAAPEHRFTAFINREAANAKDAPWGEVVPAVTVPVNARNRAAWVLGEQALLPRLAARERVDLVHSLASTSPAWGRFRRVVTVHDLIYRRYPETHGGLRGLGMRALVPIGARRSHRVIADSQSTRDDLISLLGIARERIDVVALGTRIERAREPSSEDRAAAAAATRARFELGDRPLLLTLSAKRPHKNLVTLIDALALIPIEQRPVLVLPGYPTPYELDLRAHAAAVGVQADVRFPAWVSDAELEGLWAVADAFVFASLYEGFGLPVLEAMARGVPVACSDRSSLPEVAGDAALLFDPEAPGAIAVAIGRLLDDMGLVERLRAAGLARARRFSWERTARGTLESYRRALTSSS